MSTKKRAGRINNLSARLLVNEWLVERGGSPISGDISYTDFATELRSRIAPIQTDISHARFVERADAVRYVRHVANQHVRNRE